MPLCLGKRFNQRFPRSLTKSHVLLRTWLFLVCRARRRWRIDVRLCRTPQKGQHCTVECAEWLIQNPSASYAICLLTQKRLAARPPCETSGKHAPTTDHRSLTTFYQKKIFSKTTQQEKRALSLIPYPLSLCDKS